VQTQLKSKDDAAATCDARCNRVRRLSLSLSRTRTHTRTHTLSLSRTQTHTHIRRLLQQSAFLGVKRQLKGKDDAAATCDARCNRVRRLSVSLSLSLFLAHTHTLSRRLLQGEAPSLSLSRSLYLSLTQILLSLSMPAAARCVLRCEALRAACVLWMGD
jgi:hypothetical protein